MIIKPISDYISPRKKSPRYVGGSPAQEMFYVVRQDGSELVKIGRTGRMMRRMQLYEGGNPVPVRCIVQLSVKDKDAGKILEAAAKKFLRGRYPAYKREWFAVDDHAIVALVDHLSKTCAKLITKIGGCPQSEDPPKPEELGHESHIAELRRSLRAPRHRISWSRV